MINNDELMNSFKEHVYLEENEQNDTLKIPNSNSFDNLLIFTDEFKKINKLSNMLDELFFTNQQLINIGMVDGFKSMIDLNELDYTKFQVIFNHIYEKEFERGNIEYKRTLESYTTNNKTNKLIRQIYWRMYEGVMCINKECCYYIIGIEDSGHPSFLTKKELCDSLNFISKCISDIEITYEYLFIKNTIINYDYIIIKFCPIETDFMNFFDF